jgi:hypothetical protein
LKRTYPQDFRGQLDDLKSLIKLGKYSKPNTLNEMKNPTKKDVKMGYC